MDLVTIQVTGVDSHLVAIVEQTLPHLHLKTLLKNQIFDPSRLQLLDKLS